VPPKRSRGLVELRCPLSVVRGTRAPASKTSRAAGSGRDAPPRRAAMQTSARVLPELRDRLARAWLEPRPVGVSPRVPVKQRYPCAPRGPMQSASPTRGLCSCFTLGLPDCYRRVRLVPGPGCQDDVPSRAGGRESLLMSGKELTSARRVQGAVRFDMPRLVTHGRRHDTTQYASTGALS